MLHPGEVGHEGRPNLTSSSVRAGSWRVAWILFSLVGMTLIYPWRVAENTAEIAAAQSLVDDMVAALVAVESGKAGVDDYDKVSFGFEGFVTSTPGGVPAQGFIGGADGDCLVMHWTAPDIAQVGRLPDATSCRAEQIGSVPLKSHNGYVPGTGPPFDVTPLVREAWTPLWFVAASIVLFWVAFRAATDLFTMFVRPDHFFEERGRRRRLRSRD